MRWLAISVFSLLLVTTFVSCKKDNKQSIAETVTANLEQGKWVITKFTLNGTDQTQSLNGFEFTFLSNGNVTAFKPNVNPSATGVWDVYEANDETIFYINFNNNFLLGPIGNDWRIIEQNTNLIRMEDINGNLTDQLTMVKI